MSTRFLASMNIKCLKRRQLNEANFLHFELRNWRRYANLEMFQCVKYKVMKTFELCDQIQKIHFWFEFFANLNFFDDLLTFWLKTAFYLNFSQI